MEEENWGSDGCRGGCGAADGEGGGRLQQLSQVLRPEPWPGAHRLLLPLLAERLWRQGLASGAVAQLQVPAAGAPSAAAGDAAPCLLFW